MIRINLAPPESLKNKVWFVPELLLLIVLTSAVWLTVEVYLSGIEQETARITAETDEIINNIAKLHPDIERFEQVTKQTIGLKGRLDSLESITVSKVGRYLPVILLEYLQLLKPEGMWFDSIQQKSDQSQVHIQGGAFDNLLIAEFMASISDTRFQDINPNDVRTFIYFPNITLEQITSEAGKQTDKPSAPNKKDHNMLGNKDLSLQEQKIVNTEVKEMGSSSNSKENKEFPELSKFPAFSVNIVYAERRTMQR